MTFVTDIEVPRDSVQALGNEGPVLILDAIEAALRRGNISPALGMIRSIRCRLAPTAPERRAAHPRLTERELSTLVLLPDATLSQKDIARSLGITHNTLKTHLRSLYQKLGAHSRAEAIELGGLSIGPELFESGGHGTSSSSTFGELG